MALPIKKQAKYWGIGAIVLALMLWYLGNILLPFVLGAAIAYSLDPVADRLEAAGLTRVSATGIVFVGLLLIILPAVLLAIVVLSNQIQGLLNLTIDAERVAYIESLIRSILPARLAEQFDLVQALQKLGEFISARAAAFFQNFGSQLFGALITSAGSIVNIAMLFVIAPIVAVYLLLDWDNMVARINDLIPRDHAPIVRRLASDIDATLSAFVRMFNPWNLLCCGVDGGWIELWSCSWLGCRFGHIHSLRRCLGWCGLGPWVGAVSILGGLVVTCDCGRHLFRGSDDRRKLPDPKTSWRFGWITPRLAFAGPKCFWRALWIYRYVDRCSTGRNAWSTCTLCHSAVLRKPTLPRVKRKRIRGNYVRATDL